MSDILFWYGIICLLGFLALPLSFAIFDHLPDRGYAFSKPLGLLTSSMLIWWLANLKILSFTAFNCWLMLLALGLINIILVLINKRRLYHEIVTWFRQRNNWKLIITSELIFIAGFAFIINMRSFFPALNQSEKFFDYGFINAIFSSTSLPPPDPWFDGQPMNYYYGGQFLMAVISKLSGTEPSTGYNIAMGLVYGMGATASFGFASNLVGLAKGQKKASLVGGLLGTVLVMVLGNLYPLRQVLQNGFLPLGNSNFPLQVGWPASARMIYDPMPDGRKLDILTEYPIYSYLNGDLHAHLLDAPFVLLTLGFALNLFAKPVKWVLASPKLRELGHFVAGGLLLGALYFINGGDFPTYLFLVVVLLTLAEVLHGGGWRSITGRLALQIIGLGISIWLVYFFYFSSFSGMIRAIPDPKVANEPVIGFMSRYLGWIAWPRTNLAEFVQMFGLFLLPILTFYGLKIAELWREEKVLQVKPLTKIQRLLVSSSGIGFVVCGLVLFVARFLPSYALKNVNLTNSILPVIAFSAASWTLWPGAWQELRMRPRLAIEAMLTMLLVALGALWHFELLGPCVFLLYFSLRLAVRELRIARSRFKGLSKIDLFFYASLTMAACITLFCELFYVRDIYNNRFNTVFKFWYQLWVLYGFAGAYFTWRVVSSSFTVNPMTKGVLSVSRRSFWLNMPAFFIKGMVSQFGNLVRPQPQLENGLRTQNINYTIHLGSGTGNSTMSQSLSGSIVQNQSKSIFWWRKLWFSLLIVLIIFASAVPTLAYWQATNHYSNRVGLNGEAWYSKTFNTEYPAMVWLRDYARQDYSKRGVVLEANGMNYSWAARVSTFTGLPTVVGWPYHELQWRGDLPTTDIWNGWLDMNRIYETTNIQEAKTLIQKYHIRYVFVGQVENGTRSLFSDNREFKKYSPEALAKFAKFMTAVYSDPANNIFIYEVK